MGVFIRIFPNGEKYTLLYRTTSLLEHLKMTYPSAGNSRYHTSINPAQAFYSARQGDAISGCGWQRRCILSFTVGSLPIASLGISGRHRNEPIDPIVCRLYSPSLRFFARVVLS